jgi:phosphoribosylpyrophosphate synthetase
MSYREVRKPDIVVQNDTFGTMIAKSLGAEIVPFRREYHPDGAPTPRIDLNYTLTSYESFKGKKVLTVYRRSQLPDRDAVARHLVNYPRLVYNLTSSELFDVEAVDVLYPYWIDGRSDHNPRTDDEDAVRFRDSGRGMEYKFDALAFKAAGASRILTYHPHFHREPGIIDVGGIEVVCLDAVPSMIKYAREKLGISGECVVINPDMKPKKEGKYDIAFEFAKLGDFDLSPMEKMRVDSKHTEHKTQLDAKGRDVIIVDDIGSTFSTLLGAVDNIYNAKSVDILTVHPVLTQDGHKRASAMMIRDEKRVRSIQGTHTIDSDFSRIPIHEEIAEFYNGNDKYRIKV